MLNNCESPKIPHILAFKQGDHYCVKALGSPSWIGYHVAGLGKPGEGSSQLQIQQLQQSASLSNIPAKQKPQEIMAPIASSAATAASVASQYSNNKVGTNVSTLPTNFCSPSLMAQYQAYFQQAILQSLQQHLKQSSQPLPQQKSSQPLSQQQQQQQQPQQQQQQKPQQQQKQEQKPLYQAYIPSQFQTYIPPQYIHTPCSTASYFQQPLKDLPTLDQILAAFKQSPAQVKQSSTTATLSTPAAAVSSFSNIAVSSSLKSQQPVQLSSTVSQQPTQPVAIISSSVPLQRAVPIMLQQSSIPTTLAPQQQQPLASAAPLSRTSLASSSSSELHSYYQTKGTDILSLSSPLQKSSNRSTAVAASQQLSQLPYKGSYLEATTAISSKVNPSGFLKQRSAFRFNKPYNSTKTAAYSQAIQNYLQNWNLPQNIIDIFVSEQIDTEDLIHITDDDLKELGIKMGPRKRILDAIESLKRCSNYRPIMHTIEEQPEPVVA